jgi:hypothetical protein
MDKRNFIFSMICQTFVMVLMHKQGKVAQQQPMVQQMELPMASVGATPSFGNLAKSAAAEQLISTSVVSEPITTLEQTVLLEKDSLRVVFTIDVGPYVW